MDVKKNPLEIKIPSSDIVSAWGRAQSFIGRYSDMKLQSATDFIIETHTPTRLGYGYRVIKTPEMDGSFSIKVECIKQRSIFSFQSGDDLNALILAFYIKTGQLNPEAIEEF